MAPEPVGVGFPGAEGEVLESVSLPEQTGCILDVHDWITERVVRLSGPKPARTGFFRVDLWRISNITL
jgi:hypothetical protein